MNKSNEKLEAIFEATLALETDAQRADYLNRACPNPELRREVESLLEAHQNPDSVFEEKTVLAAAPLSEGPGTRIGRYKLLQQIGEGGMASSIWPIKKNPSAGASRSRSSSWAWTPSKWSRASRPSAKPWH